MNYSILLTVEKPDLNISENSEKWKAWKSKLIRTSKKYTNLQVLGETVALIALENILPLLAELGFHLNDLNYKYALLDTEIQWHEVAKGS